MMREHQHEDPSAAAEAPPDKAVWHLLPVTLGETSRMLQMRSIVLRWKAQQLRAKSDQLFARMWAHHQRVEAFMQEQRWCVEVVSRGYQGEAARDE
jgi:hypothetical protein